MFKKVNWKKVLLTSVSIYVALFLITLIPFKHINKDFASYYDSYMTIVNANCTPDQHVNPTQLYIGYDDLSKEHWAGVTYSLEGPIIKKRFVFIDEHIWKQTNENERVSLFFHELTHAYFNYPDISGRENEKHFMYDTSNDYSTPFETYQQLNELLEGLCKK